VTEGKTPVMSEENQVTFSGKVKAFGITIRALASLHAPELAGAGGLGAGGGAGVDCGGAGGRRLLWGLLWAC
jgi:hypothetical protein